MRGFYPLCAVGAALWLAYGCGGSGDTSPAGSATSSSTGAASGGGPGSGGAGAHQGGAGGATTSASGGGATGGAGGGGTGGDTGSGGASAGGSSGTSTGGFGGGPPPPECTTQNDTCPPGQYCKAPGCGAGHCRNKPPEGMMSNDEDLVCGCDGVTYWNAHFAAHSGMSVAMPGACAGGSGPACSINMPCPAGLT